jgi:hypothetical protein
MRKIDTVSSLVQQVTEICDHFDSQVWWRGQTNFEWKLEPSIFREKFADYDERSGFQRFIQKAQSRHSFVP